MSFDLAGSESTNVARASPIMHDYRLFLRDHPRREQETEQKRLYKRMQLHVDTASFRALWQVLALPSKNLTESVDSRV